MSDAGSIDGLHHGYHGSGSQYTGNHGDNDIIAGNHGDHGTNQSDTGSYGDHGINQYVTGNDGENDTIAGSHGSGDYRLVADVHLCYDGGSPGPVQHPVVSKSSCHLNPAYEDEEDSSPRQTRPVSHSVSLGNQYHGNNNLLKRSQAHHDFSDIIISSRLCRHFRKVDIDAVLELGRRNDDNNDKVSDDSGLRRRSTRRSISSVYPSDTLDASRHRMSLSAAVSTLLMKKTSIRSYNTERIFIREQYESVLLMQLTLIIMIMGFRCVTNSFIPLDNIFAIVI